jgi:hypothetical protein
VDAGIARFDGCYGGIAYRALPAIRYRARCLRTLQLAYAALEPAVRARIDARLGVHGIVDHLARSDTAAMFEPITRAQADAVGPLTRMQRLRFYFSGTPWKPIS